MEKTDEQRKPAVNLWVDLNLHEVRCIQKCRTINDIKSWVAKKLDFIEGKETLQEKILIDMFFYTLIYCKEKNFNEEQTSAFYSIVKRTHDKMKETPFGNLTEVYKYFKDLVIIHSAKRPPFCIYLFDVNEVKSIHEYMLKTYFRHFKLYKYAFTPKILMNVSIGYEGLAIDEEDSAKQAELEDIEQENASGMNEEKGTSQDVDVKNQNGEDADANQEEQMPEDPPAVKELKSIIEAALEEQITKLKESVDEKLKANEASMLRTLNVSPGKNKTKRKK